MGLSNPISKSRTSSRLNKPVGGDVVAPKPPSWPPDDLHVPEALTKLADGVVEPEPPPWPTDDSHVSKLPTKLADNVVQPKPPSWPPDDEVFEAKLMTRPLDDPQAPISLNESTEEVYVSFGIPTLWSMYFLTDDTSSFEFACRGIHNGFPPAFILLYISSVAPSGGQEKKQRRLKQKKGTKKSNLYFRKIVFVNCSLAYLCFLLR